MPASLPTAIYTHGWWPSSLSDPAHAIYTLGWFDALAAQVIVERVFILKAGDNSVFRLQTAIAFDLVLKVTRAAAFQVRASQSLPLTTYLPGFFQLRASPTSRLFKLKVLT